MGAAHGSDYSAAGPREVGGALGYWKSGERGLELGVRTETGCLGL